METIFIVAVTYFKENGLYDFTSPVDRIFINEDDAKGYCNLMNDMPNKNYLFTYSEQKICKASFSRFA